MLFSFPEFAICHESFSSDIGHHGSVAVISLVGARHAFLLGLRVIEWCDIQIKRNQTLRKFSGNNIVIPKHTHIGFQEILSHGGTYVIHALTQGFCRWNSSLDAECVLVELRIIPHFFHRFKLGFPLAKQSYVGEEDIAVLYLRLTAFPLHRHTVGKPYELALLQQTSHNRQPTWGYESFIGKYNLNFSTPDVILYLFFEAHLFPLLHGLFRHKEGNFLLHPMGD